MSAQTSIEWTKKTWNPTRGCSRVSPGCDHCYAMREARRHDHPGGAYEGLTRIGSRGVDWNGVVRLVPEMLDAPLHWREPQRIFVNSMSDLFHESLPDTAIDQIFAVMALASRHTFQILTKRPDRMRAYLENPTVRRAAIAYQMGAIAYGHGSPEGGVMQSGGIVADHWRAGTYWPLPNVWLGPSVEDQATANLRIPILLQTPAAVRFISLEPQLAHVDLAAFLYRNRDPRHLYCPRCLYSTNRQETACPNDGASLHRGDVALDWVIVGGESGPGARPFNVAWARSVVAQCKAAGVPVFVKQVGARPFWKESFDANSRGPGWSVRIQGAEIDSTYRLHDRKGGDMAEWPWEDLRIREFPKGATA
jgi:protein gp37